ncbi:hypothetical protein [Mycobacterium intracellulare]|uniref:Uncharacterized protein n=1 Tax=Mycobacterium intracellulare subsp. chimaera TaxID=222805 RepID=A0ABT7P272_MYCIT|nr:hypothetical protein [Mycobacterium intracellulare]MDM3927391.1 hypothetical protein [Mycobacterium intracellulare subsp. chimaera]MDS0333830.1 hypothetical protein [Mycobacterium intracellulare]
MEVRLSGHPARHGGASGVSGDTLAFDYFIDETKHADYLLVAAVVVAGNLGSIRKDVDELPLPGQQRLHMKAEKAGRKRAIAAKFVRVGVQAIVYDAGQRFRTQVEAREACLRAAVLDHADGIETMMVIEEDLTLVESDRRIFYQAVRAAGCADTLRYDHRCCADSERVLGVPDAIAWCWGKGNPWHARIRPTVGLLRRV